MLAEECEFEMLAIDKCRLLTSKNALIGGAGFYLNVRNKEDAILSPVRIEGPDGTTKRFQDR